jgi:hypothetical protein
MTQQCHGHHADKLGVVIDSAESNLIISTTDMLDLRDVLVIAESDSLKLAFSFGTVARDFPPPFFSLKSTHLRP